MAFSIADYSRAPRFTDPTVESRVYRLVPNEKSGTLIGRRQRDHAPSGLVSFLDATLSFPEKVSCWLAQPKTTLQLLTNVLLLSVMAVGVTSIR